MASIVSSSPSSPPAPVVDADSIVTGACFPDQKSCTKAMRQYAVSHNMVVKLAAEIRGGAMLKYQCAGGGDCRFEVTRLRSQGQARSGYLISHSSQVQEDELIQSLVASDPRISGRVLVEPIERIRGATTSLNAAYRYRTFIFEELYGSLQGVEKLESLLLI
ncbi:Tetratricopeptide TPR_2 repeat protein [Phytophthora palmivora]|uniref:Tetratricopeptide TPR_2 repeat protein n=1 Tax=Phytophthora palmivora TaxID=4796 RepID=A0A2P4YLN3_9STRA|nr:Tetratricopeptide TPR_2 repeat protein [Phytophthora palmivora]